MPRPSLDEIFGAAPAPAAVRPSLDEIFGAKEPPPKPEPSRIPDGVSGAESMARAVLPRSFKAEEEGAGPLRLAGAGALDAISAPGRAVAAATENPITPFAYAGAPNAPKSGEAGSFTAEGGRRFADSMADTEGETLAGKIVRDLALLPAVATGGAALGLAGRAGLTGLKAATAAGALEGVTSAGIHQADRAVQGQDVNLQDAALEVGLSAAMPGAAKAVGAAAKGGARLGNKLLGRAAEELSGVSEEALRTYGFGFGEGAKKLQAAAGTQHQTGQKLVSMLDNLDDFLPEKEVVDKALQEMPAVNVANTIQRLQGAKTGGALASSRATNAKIDELVTDLAGAADQQGNIPAAKFREIRKEIDELVGDAFGKESGKYVSALKEARHQMADDLAKTAEASGRPEYAEAMRSMAQKLRKADDLKTFLGKSAQTREQRAESFISTLFGKNKEERRRAVQAMGEIFGEDFLEQSKLANLAAELGDDGRAGLLPRQFTGRAALGPALGAGLGYAAGIAPATPAFALSSPRIAAGALELAGGAGRGTEFLGQRAAGLLGTRAARAGIRGAAFRREEER